MENIMNCGAHRRSIMRRKGAEQMIKLSTLCYIEKDNQYLMLHRTKKQNDENHDKWIGVGGKFEYGESPEECVQREVKEETGYTLTSWKYRGVITFVLGESTVEYMSLFTADQYEGTQIECNEGVLEWVEKEKVPDLNLWEGDRIFLRLLEERNDFFSLKLVYNADDELQQAVLDGVELQQVCNLTEEPDISRVNDYEDKRFSKKALQQHGAFLVNGVFPYEIIITGKKDAVITGSNREYEKAVIEYFRFFAEHITRFTDERGNVVIEYPEVELFEIPLKNIQPSQFYVDKSKKKEVSTFIHSKEDVIIPLKKQGEHFISMDGHTRMSVAADKGFDSILAFLSADDVDYLEYFVTEARKRNIFTPYDLTELEHDEYEEKWNGFCEKYFEE